MPVDKFGGDWTAEKLERVRKYLAAYTLIFSRNPEAQKLISIYVDAFAETGYRTKPPRLDAQTALFEELAEPEAEAFLKGSARIALEVEPPFKQYLFIEQDAARAQELERLKQQFADRAARVKIVPQDANNYLKGWCKQTDWRICRAVMFLDPYGMQVDWSLIESIAKTRAIDLWILFPLASR